MISQFKVLLPGEICDIMGSLDAAARKQKKKTSYPEPPLISPGGVLPPLTGKGVAVITWGPQEETSSSLAVAED